MNTITFVLVCVLALSVMIIINANETKQVSDQIRVYFSITMCLFSAQKNFFANDFLIYYRKRNDVIYYLINNLKKNFKDVTTINFIEKAMKIIIRAHVRIFS